MTVTRCARDYGIPARPQGVASHPHMLTKLDTGFHPDIRRAVHGGLHGWQRLHRFQAVMGFTTTDEAAECLGVDQGTLVRQLHRLRDDIGNPLYIRATIKRPMRPTPRGQALLRALKDPRVQPHLEAAATRGNKASDQQPRKNRETNGIKYHGNRRKK